LRVATIDIGTNTVLLLVTEVGPDGELVPIVDRAEITRLGQGVDRARKLAPEAVERTLECLSRYASEIAQSGATRVAVVGTSAMRDAGGKGEKNDFLERATKILGTAPRVVSGDEEASLAFAGGLLGLGLEGDVTAFDVGGGSTELIRGRTGKGASSAGGAEGPRRVKATAGGAGGPRRVNITEVRARTSLDVGSVRLFERHVRTDPPSSTEMDAVRAFVRDQLLGVTPPPPATPLVGMAGTVTTLAAIARGIEPYDPAKVHGMRLGAAEIAALGVRLTELPLAERKRVTGLEPKRADVIPVGAAIVEAVLGWAHADEVIVSDRGVRWGLALELVRSAGT
jgi:exopolyphosphatase/guanosine-5'-triphosphate,3'-diphosphate pyrophosphatase